jgi:hypothetical protein
MMTPRQFPNPMMQRQTDSIFIPPLQRAADPA